MKFFIEVEGSDARQVIESLDEVRKTLLGGGCYLNVGGCVNAKLRAENEATAEQWRSQWAKAHPRTPSWPT
jgi:hypothetical protein